MKCGTCENLSNVIVDLLDKIRTKMAVHGSLFFFLLASEFQLVFSAIFRMGTYAENFPSWVTILFSCFSWSATRS